MIRKNLHVGEFKTMSESKGELKFPCVCSKTKPPFYYIFFAPKTNKLNMQSAQTELDFIKFYLEALSDKSVRYGDDYLARKLPSPLRIKVIQLTDEKKVFFLLN